MDWYIPYHSHHHPRMLTVVIRGMHDRALQIFDNTSKQPEMEHLPECLKPTGQEDPIAKPGRKQKHEQSADEEPQRTLHVPYVWGLSKKIEKTCAPLGVKVVFKPQSTLKQPLVRVKQKMPEEKKMEVVYQVPCKDCSKVYIGETKRTLKIRMAEHKQAVQKGDEKNSIVVHSHTTNHCIDWEGARVHGTA